MKELDAILHALVRRDEPAALATLVTAEGSSYRRPGARLLLAGETKIGSISGGCLEDDVRVRAGHVLASGRAEVVVYDTTDENDLVWGVGLGCHGVVRVVIERVPPRPDWARAMVAAPHQPHTLATVWSAPDVEALGTRIWSPAQPLPPGHAALVQEILPAHAFLVCGAGDDARPLVRLAAEMGWSVTVLDPRPAFATRDRFPAATAVHVARPDEDVRHFGLACDDRMVAVVMSHHYRHDLPWLRQLLPRPLAYLGLLGPRRRAERILADLAAAGTPISAESRQRLRAPVGLDLGGDTPESVALAIVAEVQAVLAGRDARPLRQRTRPIHSSA